jgi:hypothetical protein
MAGHHVEIAVANATSGHLDQNLPRPWGLYLNLPDVQLLPHSE